ncbi:MAG TPA: polysaccharide biosynthesis tyrosine autokinase [Paracoccaceae bacterium]|nr:polysaccharide biosynthesis tyrosine autokinase [Paracoccaceae bacterium]
MNDRPQPSLPPPMANEDDEIDLLALAASLWAGRWRIALVTVLALGAGAFYALDKTPIYRADGLLQLEVKRSALALPTGMQDLLGDETASVTEIEILRSRMVLGRVVDELGLDIMAAPQRLPVVGGVVQRIGLPRPDWAVLDPYAWNAEAIEVGELELPADWVGAELTLTALGDGRFQVDLPDGTRREGLVQTRIEDATLGFSLRVDRLDGAAGRVFTVQRRPRSEAMAALRNAVSVSESTRNSSILRLEVTNPDRQRAARILDAIARVYVDQNVARSAAEAQRSLEFIESQLPEAQAEVAEAEAALNSYRQQAQSVDLTFETQALLERATAIEQDLARLELEEQALADRYTRNHPAVQALLRNREGLEADLASLRDQAGALPETQKEIFNLTRNLEVAQQVYFQFLNRMQELQVLRASSIGSVRIIDMAQAGRLPIEPRKSRILALAGLLGLMGGGAWVLVARALRRGVRGGEELERAGLPVFATVPFTATATARRKTRGTMPILALQSPDDLAVEALRSLRTALHFGMLDAGSKAVLITSTAPEAGKSFTSVNLAVVAAQAGQKVCLIDADMRRGYLRRYFGLDRGAPGLAEHLAGDRPLDEVLHPGPVPGLTFLPTGQYPPNPSEILMRPSYPAMMASLSERFDLVLVDSPPVLAVTDPVILARATGAVIAVVRHMVTAPGEVEALRRAFETAGMRVTGAVLNGWRASEGARYGGRYANYNYRYSYARDRR